MAEFCKKCFLEIEGYHEDSEIVMSKDEDFCEGCTEWKPVVLEIEKGVASKWKNVQTAIKNLL